MYRLRGKISSTHRPASPTGLLKILVKSNVSHQLGFFFRNVAKYSTCFYTTTFILPSTFVFSFSTLSSSSAFAFVFVLPSVSTTIFVFVIVSTTILDRWISQSCDNRSIISGEAAENRQAPCERFRSIVSPTTRIICSYGIAFSSLMFATVAID